MEQFNRFNSTPYNQLKITLRERRKLNLPRLTIPHHTITEFRTNRSVETDSSPTSPSASCVKKIRETKNVTKLVLRKSEFKDVMVLEEPTTIETNNTNNTQNNLNFNIGEDFKIQSGSPKIVGTVKKRKREMEIEDDHFNKKVRSL
jgi:hypothetical protein